MLIIGFDFRCEFSRWTPRHYCSGAESSWLRLLELPKLLRGESKSRLLYAIFSTILP